MAYFLRVKPIYGLGDAGADASLPFSLIAAGTTNATLVKSGPGVIVAIHAINVAAAVRYLKFYDLSRVPVAGQSTPVRRYGIPGNTAGAGFVFVPSVGIEFLQGIAFTMTTGVADSDATALTANDVVLTLEYI